MEANEENDYDNKFKGNYSTKIKKIVELILKLKTEDNDVKILVFSTWSDVLKVLKSALKNNNIKAEQPLRALETSVDKFKNADTTVLILPVGSCSSGLNLIEATHVILVEPLLNPAEELQAIARVDRIGQTKPTFVHKFIMKDTIEEILYQVTSSKSWNTNTVSLQHLKDLFIKEAQLDDDDDDVSTETSESGEPNTISDSTTANSDDAPANADDAPNSEVVIKQQKVENNPEEGDKSGNDVEYIEIKEEMDNTEETLVGQASDELQYPRPKRQRTEDNITPTCMDKFDIFGKTVASKLREFKNQRRRLAVESKMLNLLNDFLMQEEEEFHPQPSTSGYSAHNNM